MPRTLLLGTILLLLTISGSAATYTVTNTSDSGLGSLRQAIATANSTPDDDVIVFNIPGCPNGVCRIVLTSGELLVVANGALAISNPSGPQNLVISGNNASRIFRAEYYARRGLMIEGITIEDGNAAWGGGISIRSEELLIKNSLIQNCVGGGIYSYATNSLRIEDSTIRQNTSDEPGGIFCSGCGLVVKRSNISRNQGLYGGAIRLYGDGGITIIDSTISDNTAVSGGAISIFPGYGGGAVIINSTLSGNRASVYGGAVDLWGGGKYGYVSLTLLNTTMTENSAAVGGAVSGFGADHTTVITRNSIVAGNTASSGYPDIDPSDLILNDLGNNIISRPALLGPLADNGGPTRTHALLPGSPAINAGNNCVQTENGCNDGNPALAADQRGLQRNGTVDIGAFERQSNESRSAASFDFDGDGQSDISLFRLSDAVWYLDRSTAGFTARQFGLPSDDLAPADFDADGMTDVAVYRASEGTWYWLNSSTGTLSAVQFGSAEDLPTPADYDGDGRADTSVFRPSNGVWYRLNSHDGSFYAVQFGASEDKPTIGDYDGDGLADAAVFRPSNGAWYWLNSSNGQIGGGIAFGLATDLPTPADFDGDGKTDAGVYRPSNGTWYSLDSSNGAMRTTPFGTTVDIPTAADYDGDGRADISVFRPSSGVWYRLNSGNGSFFATPFGLNGDRPTPAAFRY